MLTTCTQHSWIAPDGQTFSYSHWASSAGSGAEPAVMVAVHGLSGAALDYEPLGHRLALLGIPTYAPELRGQGNDPDPKRRGDLDRLETWYADLHTFLVLVRSQHPDVPLYYYGESMGAALLTRFLAQATLSDQPAGLILASPVVALQEKPPGWMNLLFRFLLLVWPTFRIDVRKLAKKDEAPRHVTRDETHREWFKTAPHKLDCFTIRFFKCLHDLIAGCHDAATRIVVPVLVIYARHDIFIRAELVESFFEQLGSKDKELGFFPESYHLLLHDHDREDVLQRVVTWLGERVGAVRKK
jgi:acylglycerol lipase